MMIPTIAELAVEQHLKSWLRADSDEPCFPGTEAKLESFFLRSSPSLKWLQATRPRSCTSDLSFPQSGQTRVVPRAAEESQPSMMRSQRAYTFQRDARNRPFVPWTSPTKRDRRSRLLRTDRSAPIVDLFHPESQRYILNLPDLGFLCRTCHERLCPMVSHNGASMTSRW